MTEQQILDLGPALADYLDQFQFCCDYTQTFRHLGTYCRGLLSDLDRKTAEPIALASGTGVRTMQLFLTQHGWDHALVRQLFQRHVSDVVPGLPDEGTGTVGVIDESGHAKKGDKTPGVKRQYCGELGKKENCIVIVTVHVGVAHGRFQALLDADLYLPKSWDDDRPRCEAAGIPEDMHYQSKWRIALDQLLRLHRNGVRFDWLTFDEGYGSKVPFLGVLSLVGQKFVAEVPVNFAVRTSEEGVSRRADEVFTAEDAKEGRRFRFPRETQADQWWRAKSVSVWVDGRAYRLVVAINQATAEVKYFVTNAVGEPLRRTLAVAFRRATVEHSFRLGKREAGLMHYEGRQYVGLMRHLILSLIVMGFVSIHTDRLRGGKSAGDEGASMPCVERAVCDPVSSSAGDAPDQSCGRGNPLSPASKRAGHTFPQKEAA